MTGLGFVVLIAVIVVVVLAIRSGNEPPPMYCTICGTVAPARLVTPGSTAIEVVLWFSFFVPGLLYSLWRRSTQYWACPACGAPDIIPADSPNAVEARRRFPHPYPETDDPPWSER